MIAAPAVQLQAVDEHIAENAELPAALLTTSQAADYLQVSVRTVKNLLGDGQVAFVKIGRSTRIPREDLDGYIARNRRKRRYGHRAG